MEETFISPKSSALKNVKIIFTDLDGCPVIDMSSVVYNTKVVDEFFKKNGNEDIKFDDFVYYIRQIPTSVGVIHCNSFITWWANNSTHKYYWPKWEMTINVSRGYYSDIVRIGGLIEEKYTTGCHAVAFPRSDFDMTLAKRHVMYSTYGIPSRHFQEAALHIKDVIFNDPATIIFWSDGTKTVCTCSEQDTYDPEKGLALCVMKKMLYNNKGHIFNNAREKWLKKGEKKR